MWSSHNRATLHSCSDCHQPRLPAPRLLFLPIVIALIEHSAQQLKILRLRDIHGCFRMLAEQNFSCNSVSTLTFSRNDLSCSSDIGGGKQSVCSIDSNISHQVKLFLMVQRIWRQDPAIRQYSERQRNKKTPVKSILRYTNQIFGSSSNADMQPISCLTYDKSIRCLE